MIHLRFNPFTIAISGLLMLSLSVVIAGCGGDGDDDDVMSPVVSRPPTTKPPQDPPNPPVEQPPPKEEPKDVGVSFKNDIQPILNATCAVAGCHKGGGAAGGLNLETYANFKKGGNAGPAFKPKKSKQSLVVKRIDGGGMPRNRPPLKKDKIQLFKDWIDEGAKEN